MISERARAAALELLFRERESVSIPMRGSSMRPTLKEGDRIAVQPLRRAPRIGDIVVFGESSRWIAHRVIAVGERHVYCAGDAQPESVETVKLEAIVGIVARNVLDRLRGLYFARARRIRALVRIAHPAHRERVYATLVRAARAIVREDAAALLRAIDGATPWKIAAVARRHRLAPLLGRALSPYLAQSEYASALASRVAADQYRALLRAPRYREQVCDVLRILRSASIEPVLLKGAARIIAGEADAALFSAQDIDVLVHEHEVEAARGALVRAGYTTRESAYDYAVHHHAAPLYPAVSGVPVEIHRHLGAEDEARMWNRAALAPFVCATATPEHALVLDEIGASLHNALHAHRRPELREVVILGRRLRAMSCDRRFRLRDLLPRETPNAVAIEAVVAFAAYLADVSWPVTANVRRYLRWSILREDLPRPLRAYPACVDAWLGASHGSRLLAALRAAAQAHGSRRRTMGMFVRLLCGLATPYYARRMR